MQAVAPDGSVWDFGCSNTGSSRSRAEIELEISETADAVKELHALAADGFGTPCIQSELKQAERVLAELNQQLEALGPDGPGLRGEWVAFARHFDVRVGDLVKLATDHRGELLVAVECSAGSKRTQIVECVLRHQLEGNDLTGWSLWLPAVSGKSALVPIRGYAVQGLCCTLQGEAGPRSSVLQPAGCV